MANKADTTSIFRIVAITTAVLLVAAAALTYLQGAGVSPQAAELAALSQAIPTQAKAALDGEDGGFDNLGASLRQLAQQRRSAGPAVPGAASDWQQLESRAAAILARRDDVEALNRAATSVTSSVAAILELSNELLDRSSATAIIQEFQQRVSRIGQSAPGLAVNSDAAAAAAAIASC